MLKYLFYLFSIIKTIYINFRYIEWSKACRLPIAITCTTKISFKGKVELPEKVSFAMVRVGFHHVPICNSNDITSLIVENDGLLSFKGGAHIGNGTKIYVARNAHLIIGDNFAVSASSAINCYKSITFGRDVQFSWECLVMDSDTHQIFDKNGCVINNEHEISFDDKIWVGCRTLVLKGSHIPSNCVIGADSLVSGTHYLPNSIIVGRPAKSVKTIGGWSL